MGRKTLFGGVGAEDARFNLLGNKGNNGCNSHFFSQTESGSELETGSKSGSMQSHETSTVIQRDSISSESDLVSLGAFGMFSKTERHVMIESGGGDMGGFGEEFICSKSDG